MKAYSMDYREAAARAYDQCGSSAEVADVFGCSESWVCKLVARRRATGSPAALSSARTDDQRRYGAADDAAVRELIAGKPDATPAEVAEAVGKPACTTTVWRALARLELPRKKSRRTRPSGTGRT